MKRFAVVGIAAAAMVAALSSYGQTNVYSRNAVGAIRVDIPPTGQFALAGYNFKPIGADTITCSDLFGTNQLVKNNFPTFATRIYFWDPAANGYLTVFQKADGNFYRAASPYPATNPVISAGQGFWIQSPNGATTTTVVYLMGEVISSNDLDRVMVNTFQLIANPYSAPLDLNDTNIHWQADGATANNFASFADQCFIWNGAGYDAYYLRASDWKWHYQVGNALGSNAAISVGGGAWYKARNVFTNSLVRPYPWW